MKVNLRKALQIRSAISARLGELSQDEISTTKSVSLFAEKPDKVVSTARDNLLGTLKILDNMERILFDLRARIGRANVEYGVNDLLAQDAMLHSRLRRYSQLAAASPVQETTEMRNEVATRKEAFTKQERFMGSRSDNVTFNMLRAEDIEKMRRKMLETTRERSELSEKLLSTNINSTIEIPDDDVDFLKEHSVL